MCQCLLISQGPLKQPQELRGDFSGLWKGERVTSSHLSGMRSSWLKIHIQAGVWKKYPREKKQKGLGWAAGNILCQFCPSHSAAPAWQTPCELWYGPDHCFVIDPVLVLHLP